VRIRLKFILEDLLILEELLILKDFSNQLILEDFSNQMCARNPPNGNSPTPQQCGMCTTEHV